MIEVIMDQVTPKKHVIRYDYLYTKETLDERPAVTSIYISRDHLPKDYPKKIKVVITEVSE